MIEQEVVYERKLTGSYMKIAAVNCSSFDERMLLSGKVRGTLTVEQCYMNDKAWYWYNISGKQSLDTYCRIRDVGITFIEKIIISICDEIAILEWSLFDLNCLLLAPDFIFINNLNQEIIFTLYPGGKEELSQQFRELMEYLLTKVDHNDAEAVRAAYGIYERTLDEAYDIMDIRDCIIQNRREKNLPKDVCENSNEFGEDGKDIGENSGHYNSFQVKDSNNNPRAKGADHIPDESHKVFPELMKILNGWKWNLTKGKRTRSSRSQSLQTVPEKNKQELTYIPQAQVPLQVAENIGPKDIEAENIGQTTCLNSYSAYVQGKLIYIGTENMENISLMKQDVIIGKSSQADISIGKNTISQFHAKISFKGQDFFLEDLNSTNGTFVNEAVLPYKQVYRLQVNDIVRFADVTYRFI